MSQLSLFAEPRAAVSYQDLSLEWREITIGIRYCPAWYSDALQREFYGHGIAHLEIRSPRPLAGITNSGYLSHFNRPDNIGDPVEFVRGWIEAKS